MDRILGTFLGLYPIFFQCQGFGKDRVKPRAGESVPRALIPRNWDEYSTAQAQSISALAAVKRALLEGQQFSWDLGYSLSAGNSKCLKISTLLC